MQLAIVLVLATLAASEPGARSDATSPQHRVLDLESPIRSDVPQGRIFFESFGARERFTALSTHAMLQGNNRILWIGTDDGLYGMIGGTLRKYGLANGLPSAEVKWLVSSSEGDLWVGGSWGLARMVAGSFKALPSDQTKHLTKITDMIAGPDGSVLIGTRDGLFTFRSTTLSPVQDWAKRGASALAPSASAGSYFALSGDTLYQTNLATSAVWARLPVSTDGPASLAVLSRERLLVKVGSRLFSIDPAREVREHTQEVPPLSNEARLAVDELGRAWLPTTLGFAVALSKGTALEWRHFGAEDGVPLGRYRTALLDKDGTLWLGGNTLRRLKGQGLWRAHTAETGLSWGRPLSLFRDETGTLWVGAERALLRADGAGWHPVAGSQERPIYSITPLDGGKLLLGSNALALGIMDRQSASITWLPPPPWLQTSETKVRGTSRAPDGTIWIAAGEAGLFEIPQGKIENVRKVTFPWSTEGDSFNSVLVDQRNRVFAASKQGLSFYVDAQWRRFTQANGLRRQELTSLSRVRSDTICFTYAEPVGAGCLSMDPKTLGFVVDHLGMEVTGERAAFVGSDASGRIWVGTGGGVKLLMGEDQLTFGEPEGLPSDIALPNVFLAEPNGDIWVGVRGGLARFSSTSLTPPDTIPALVEGFEVDGEWVELERNRSALVLPGGRHHAFHLAFGAASNSKRTELFQQYRLVDDLGSLDTTTPWIELGTARGAELDLKPGSSLLEVRARRAGSTWGPTTRLTLTVEPAFLQRPFVRGLALTLLLAGALLGLYWLISTWRARTRLMQSHRASLQEAVASMLRLRERASSAIAEFTGEARRMVSVAARENEMASRQASALREMSASLETVTRCSRSSVRSTSEMLETVHRSEENAASGQKASSEAVAMIESLMSQVRTTAERMRALDRHAQQITEIIDTVRHVAERSNVLALNASIEAVRAGEHGRGFLVVAKEMNQLAEQSKRSAERIRAQLTEVQKESVAAMSETLEEERRAQEAASATETAGHMISGLSEAIRSFASAAQAIENEAQTARTYADNTLNAVNQFSLDVSDMMDTSATVTQIAENLTALSKRVSDEMTAAVDPNVLLKDIKEAANEGGSP